MPIRFKILATGHLRSLIEYMDWLATSGAAVASSETEELMAGGMSPLNRDDDEDDQQQRGYTEPWQRRWQFTNEDDTCLAEIRILHPDAATSSRRVAFAGNTDDAQLGNDGFILFFSVNDRASLANLKQIHDDITTSRARPHKELEDDHSSYPPIIIVGNYSLTEERQVTADEGRELCKSFGSHCIYLEVHIANNVGVTDIITKLIEERLLPMKFRNVDKFTDVNVPDILHEVIVNRSSFHTGVNSMVMKVVAFSKFPLHTVLILCSMFLRSAKRDLALSSQYSEQQHQLEKMSMDMLNMCNSAEAQQLLATPNLLKQDCLELAVRAQHKAFVAHHYVQTRLQGKWMGKTGRPLVTETVLCTLFAVLGIALMPLVLALLAVNQPLRRIFLETFSPPRAKCIMHTSFYALFLGILVWLSYTKQPHPYYIQPAEAVCYFWVTTLAVEELQQCHTAGLKRYVKDKWNWMDILIYVLYLVVAVLRFVSWGSSSYTVVEVSNAFVAAAIVLSFARVLNVLLVNTVLGPLQLIITQMLVDVLVFVMVAIVFIVGFAVALTRLYIDDDKAHAEAGTFPHSISTLFWAIFTVTSADDIPADNNLRNVFGHILMAVFMVVVAIVLINLLIAMMSSTYSRVQESADVEWKYARATFITSYEQLTLMPAPINIVELVVYVVISGCTKLWHLKKRFNEVRPEAPNAQMTASTAMRDTDFYDETADVQQVNLEDLQEQRDSEFMRHIFEKYLRWRQNQKKEQLTSQMQILRAALKEDFKELIRQSLAGVTSPQTGTAAPQLQQSSFVL
eukprot:TRINITY_DN1376_c0_g1_i2.p1 TRINITY_DN1376_c0_g1~~TRINITY_DN1376_c0_g1_i2.p1  ORF type:complete len:818 (+),score=257.22 TRINITY_DN1376_c0_g1_i2:72-2456(+)